MISSPIEAVVGSTNLKVSSEFLELFGFTTAATAALPEAASRALYDLGGSVEECLLVMPGADQGRVRFVSTPKPARQHAPFDPRPFAIDLFTVDVDRSVALATDARLGREPGDGASDGTRW